MEVGKPLNQKSFTSFSVLLIRDTSFATLVNRRYAKRVCFLWENSAKSTPRAGMSLRIANARGWACVGRLRRAIYDYVRRFWRSVAESNHCTKLCRLLHNHSANRPQGNII